MCYKCGSELNFSGTVDRSDVCPSCGADVRCCRNCTWYEPGAHYDCHETIEFPETDKERANFCDFFRLNTKVGGTSAGKQADDGAKKARDAFNALFGD